MRYRVKQGESPTFIARQHRVPFGALIAANPHKPTKMVDGRRTWESVGIGEEITVPSSGMVGDSASDAINAVIAAGGPCLQANAALVCAAQHAMGVSADGKWGNDTSTAARKYVSNAPAGCSPRPSWWAPAGQVNCVTVPTPPPSAPAAPTAAAGISVVAMAALAALGADSNYCTSVGRVGTAVNTAVHNFKAAWNAANPSNPVPIGTGKYEPVVASALSSALGGAPVPPGCGAAAPAPVPGIPAPVIVPVPTPIPSAPIPTAIQALSSFNPCDQANVAFVRQAQSALGVSVDGKYGTDTAAAARKYVPSAPAGCSPRPAWWTAPGQGNGGAPLPPAPPPVPPPPVHPVPPPGPVTPPPQVTPTPPPVTPVQPAQPGTPGALVTPEKKGLSTGAMVLGAIGAVALVGVIAMAASGGKKAPAHHGGGAPHHPGHKPARRHATHKKTAHKHAKPKRKKKK